MTTKIIYRMRGRAPTLPERTGLPPSTLYDLIRRKQFPAGIPLTDRPGGPVGWPSDVIDQWEADRAARRAAI